VPDDSTGAALFKLDAHTARELCALPDPPATDQLLGSLVVRHYRTIIGGRTGEGKTTAALAILDAVVNAKPSLEWCGVGGRGLVLDLEQGARTVKRRLREAGLDWYGHLMDQSYGDASDKLEAALFGGAAAIAAGAR
jgi:hypothetical protein